MKHLFTLTFVLLSLISFSQTNDPLQPKDTKMPEQVSFYTVLDVNNLTKDGIYAEGYVLHLDYDQVKELSGKKIKITGEISIVTGQENIAKEYDENGNEIFSQGRVGDTKHILSPEIEIVED